MGRVKKETGACCGVSAAESSISVDSIVSVDERGQMVLPKELRSRAGIRAGEKLALSVLEKDGEVCCIVLMKAGDLMEMIRSRLGPLLKEM